MNDKKKIYCYERLAETRENTEEIEMYALGIFFLSY